MLPVVDRRCIRLWRFEDAPAEYQQLSAHGGDEDWVLYIPAWFATDDAPLLPPDWLCRIDTSHDPQIITLPNGAQVWIGAHA